MEKTMIYAPVLIPTLCRDEHFIRCIESLKRNAWAKYTDIYIALDFPCKESHWDGYNKICKYLEGDFAEFASFHVIKRKENFGPRKNMSDLRANIFKKYDRFIRTDDDIEFSPNFLEYMNKCLLYYEEDEDVIAVTGYSYPIPWTRKQGCNTIKNNFVCSTWGIGFWRNKFLKIERELVQERYLRKIFNSVIKNGKIKNLTNARYLDYVNGCLNFNKECFIDRITDIALGTYISLTDKFVITPTTSKVRNLGFDGSGVYCSKVKVNDACAISAGNYLYEEQEIDEDEKFTLCADDSVDCSENYELMNNFDVRPKSNIIKAYIKIGLYRTLGEKLYKKLNGWYGKKDE